MLNNWQLFVIADAGVCVPNDTITYYRTNPTYTLVDLKHLDIVFLIFFPFFLTFFYSFISNGFRRLVILEEENAVLKQSIMTVDNRLRSEGYQHGK